MTVTEQIRNALARAESDDADPAELKQIIRELAELCEHRATVDRVELARRIGFDREVPLEAWNHAEKTSTVIGVQYKIDEAYRRADIVLNYLASR